MCRPTRPPNRGTLLGLGETSEDYAQPLHRGTGGSMYTRKAHATREAPNLYMRWFVLGWKKLGFEQSLGTRLVTYADDLVILCRRGSAENALHHLREIMGKLKLTVNEEKTRICKVPDGEFDFLGYSVLQAHTERSSSWTDQSCGQAA